MWLPPPSATSLGAENGDFLILSLLLHLYSCTELSLLGKGPKEFGLRATQIYGLNRYICGELLGFNCKLQNKELEPWFLLGGTEGTWVLSP